VGFQQSAQVIELVDDAHRSQSEVGGEQVMADGHGAVEFSSAHVDADEGDPTQCEGPGPAGFSEGDGAFGLGHGFVEPLEVAQHERGFDGERGRIERTEPGAFCLGD